MNISTLTGKAIGTVRENKRDTAIWLAVIVAIGGVIEHWIDARVKEKEAEQWRNSVKWRLGDTQEQMNRANAPKGDLKK